MAKTDFTRDQTINIAVKMGKILLKSGAETKDYEGNSDRILREVAGLCEKYPVYGG